MHLVNKNGVFVAMKGNLEQELSKEVETKLEKKYTIIKKETFYLPKEESIRTLLVMKNR